MKPASEGVQGLKTSTAFPTDFEFHCYQLFGHNSAFFLCRIQSPIPRCFPGGSDSKESACNAGDLGWIPRSGRVPGEGNGYPLQYSCLENPMDGEAWQAIVHEVTESDMTELLTHTLHG